MPPRAPSSTTPAPADDGVVVIPLAEDVVSVGKREIETGRVRVQTVTDTHDVLVREDLVRGGVEIERVTIGRRIDSVPPVRDEGDTIIVPIVEEILVVEKRLMLKEELHIRRSADVRQHEETVTLRRQRAVTERSAGNGEPV